MTGSRIAVVGCGYVGLAAAELLAADGHRVFGVRRSTDGLPPSIVGVALDAIRGDLGFLPEDLDAVVWAIAPGAGEAAYRAAYVDGPRRLATFLQDRGDPVHRFVLVSSTSVWGCNDGRELDEESPVMPMDHRGELVWEGEQALAAAHPDTVALRFGGIYGPGRTRMIDGVAAGAARRFPRPVYGNRIHRDDGAKAIAHILGLDTVEERYVVVDDDPADQNEVITWLAGRLGVPVPPVDPDGRPARGSKRCRDARLRASGWPLRYPTFREGLGSLIEREDLKT